MTTQQQFLDLLSNIEPSTTTVNDCSSAHNTLRDALEAHNEFSKVHVNTFLSGSYRRKTAVRPTTIGGITQRPDVDIIALTNHTIDDKPQDVLDAVHSALKDIGYTKLTVNRRSVNVELKKVDMDVVPIISDGYDGYLIPDIHLKKWLTTNPPAHTQWTIDVNKQANFKFKPLVKLFKWWKRENLPDLKRPKGFILECLVAKHMDYNEKNYEKLFVYLLETIRDSYEFYASFNLIPHLEDPGVAGNNVFSAVTAEEFKTFYEKVKEQAAIARNALNETDDDKALALWRQVLGKCFPRLASHRSAESSDMANSLIRPALGVGLTFPSKPVYPNKPGGFA
ncbi:SMODS domain-containing nucleotidyltransferase [Acinetobacter radioresistens]|uniref:SMODS domain-containing nucleotidyltransferase n=1 Tax=Acinetobacter radioresistens TaxID=40216 RepID=UPI0022485CBB|nr:nucleotidyltransferase [Acinetobacter radioresistens]MCX0340751.1 nucleotidyltransferase [Acinetobacter radioresistens]